MGMQFDDVLEKHVGANGRYQVILLVLCGFATTLVGMHTLSWVFSGQEQMDFRCARFGETYSSPYDAFPCVTNEDKEKCVKEACSASCSQLIFNRIDNRYTAVEKFPELPCNHKILNFCIMALYFVGQLLCSLVFGSIADRFGRRIVMLISLLLLMIAGFCLAMAPVLWIFMLCRLAIGFACIAIYTVSVILTTEFLGTKQRRISTIAASFGYSIAQVFLGIEAYYIHDYQWLLAAIAGPSLLFIGYYWLIPESPRWLASQKRYEEATTILKKVAKVNGTTIPDEWYISLENDARKAQGSYWDLLSSGELLKRTLINAYFWFMSMYAYFAVALEPKQFGLNPYLALIITSSFLIPDLFIVSALMDRCGRKVLLNVSFFLAGLTILLNDLFPDAPFWIRLIEQIICRCSLQSVRALQYTYTSELFPTTIRSRAVGAVTIISRFGAILCTFMHNYEIEGVTWKVTGILCFLVVPLVYLGLPETMGKPLPETVEEVSQGGQEEEQPPQE